MRGEAFARSEARVHLLIYRGGRRLQRDAPAQWSRLCGAALGALLIARARWQAGPAQRVQLFARKESL